MAYPQQPAPFQYPALRPDPPRRGHRALWIALGGAGAILALCCGGIAAIGTEASHKTTPTRSSSASPSAMSPSLIAENSPAASTATVTEQATTRATTPPTTAAHATPPTVEETTTPPPADVYYANCAAARAAGAAPIYQGEPGYRPALDRDHDGVACE